MTCCMLIVNFDTSFYLPAAALLNVRGQLWHSLMASSASLNVSSQNDCAGPNIRARASGKRVYSPKFCAEHEYGNINVM